MDQFAKLTQRAGFGQRDARRRGSHIVPGCLGTATVAAKRAPPEALKAYLAEETQRWGEVLNGITAN